ncbi:MAG TPA: hypothetical protein VHY35_10505 [Stellaceae bacterium]|jgi:hypothetical protein|nr:hypothetical protein [Stellaceae bacterium]
MDDTELKAILAGEINTALGSDGGMLSQERRMALDYYMGQPFGNEIEGRSQVVSRNVLETIEWVKPALLRCFLASDKVFEFEPYQPGEEAMAEQATDYCNYIMLRDNPGFMILHDFFTSALLQKVGFLKVYWNEERTFSTSTYQGLDDLQYQQITQADDVEIISEKTYPNPDPNLQWFTEDAPEPGAPMLHDVQIRVWQTEGRVKIEHVVPEEMLVSRRAPSTVLDGKHFVCHRALKSISDLREMGFDEDLIEEAQGFNDQEFNMERIERFAPEDEWPMDQRTDQAMRQVWLEESYLPVDYDGDGIAELRRIVTAGAGQIIFSNELVDEVPIVACCPIPVPGKFYGLSEADLVMDLQSIKSTLLRQVLDNLYLSNSPRMIVDEMSATTETYDDLLTVRPGGIVRVANVQGIQPLEVPFVAGQTLPIIQYLDQASELRTGIDRHNQGLSPDDLNRHTAQGISMLQQAASQRVELIARIFAEQVRELGQRILGLVVRHQQRGRVIRLTGKWVNMDPKDWRESMSCSCSVGLGTGNRDSASQQLMQILQVQQQIVGAQGGVQGPLVTAQNIFDVVHKLTTNAGYKQDFFTNPSQAPQQPPQPKPPDPEMVKAQAQAQAAQFKAQNDMQVEQQKAAHSQQLEQQMAQHQMQIAAMQAQHEIQLEQMREQSRAQLAIQTAQMKANNDMHSNVMSAQNDMHNNVLTAATNMNGGGAAG